MKKLSITVAQTVTAVAVLGMVQQSGAALLLGNYPPNDAHSTPIAGSLEVAVRFTMPATAYTVDNAVFRLANYNTTGGGGDTAVVKIFNDVGTSTPGTLVGTLTGPNSSSDAIGDFTFTPSGTLTLAAGQQYFMALDATAGGFDWFGSDPTVAPTGVATFGGYRLSTDNGATYPLGYGSFETFALNATVVPEPATVIALCSMLVPALAIVLRRRKKS